MNKSYLTNNDIARYIEIYQETYGEVIDPGIAELHLEVLVEFVEMLLKEEPLSVSGKYENEQYGPGISTT